MENSPETPVGVAAAADGTLLHALPLAPEALPPVAATALRAAWDAARRAAAAEAPGPARALLFMGADGVRRDLLLADADARCWALAVERLAGLDTTAGVALLVRLLALVDLLARVRFLDPLFDVSLGGTVFHPSLLDAAARQPLDQEGRFDAAAWRMLFEDRLGLRPADPAPAVSPTLSLARARRPAPPDSSGAYRP
ncbi:hypothetical protein ACQW02_13860 [Humitalea sp. 24SJ18S-53]|uniref:hypothetical protein n=1 Tax=Humitalea sp. 24SJ18S-53 TaxID=3422307 RepID=UPI003D673806